MFQENDLYRPPSDLIVSLENFFFFFFVNKIKKANKMLHIAGKISLVLQDYENFKKVQESLNLVYEKSMIPIQNKPT